MYEERKIYKMRQTIKNRLDFIYLQNNRKTINRFLELLEPVELEVLAKKPKAEIKEAIFDFQQENSLQQDVGVMTHGQMMNSL